LSFDEIGFVSGGVDAYDSGNMRRRPEILDKNAHPMGDLCVFTMTPNRSLGRGGLVVGCTYIRKGDKPINVTVTARNSDGSYQVRDNNTGVVTRFTPYRG
jgi:hypothetical protein